MNVTLSYLGRSGLSAARGSQTLNLVPNLARDPVSFDAPLLQPLRFREAISSLHDVVVSDLRFKPRDKSAYLEWKRSEENRLVMLHRAEEKRAKAEILSRRDEPVPADLERSYERCRTKYWRARQAYSNYLLQHDHELWRLLMPCDPVITVADDVVFFECFSADESSYGCLTVERAVGFGPCDKAQFGTTNVDYSWDLFDSFQQLRTYRDTRFRLDPTGFEVATAGLENYREEKIDLPAGWLRGFMQIQAAMCLPMRRVSITRDAVYSMLAWLKRNRARKSPRALRFELVPGRSPALVLEPWERRIESTGSRYDGPAGDPIRIWGTRRLLVFARLLPLLHRCDVYLLGTGLPSFWVAQMGEMRLTLGLSGWTANDWTRSTAIDLLTPPAAPTPAALERVSNLVRSRGKATFSDVDVQCARDSAEAAAALNHLAHAGQLIADLSAGVYRWRQIMPRALGEAEIGPENIELQTSRAIVERGQVAIESRHESSDGTTVLKGTVDRKPVELVVDSDGRIRRGKCVCSHHYRFGIRMGPCRHLLALRTQFLSGGQQGSPDRRAWYRKIQSWATG
jgi:hypothetical protein